MFSARRSCYLHGCNYRQGLSAPRTLQQPPKHHFFPLCVRSATVELALSTTATIVLIQQSDFLIHSQAKRLSLCFGTQDRLDLPAYSSHSAETRPIDHRPGSVQTETGTWPPRLTRESPEPGSGTWHEVLVTLPLMVVERHHQRYRARPQISKSPNLQIQITHSNTRCLRGA